jgi:hypothetical protein
MSSTLPTSSLSSGPEKKLQTAYEKALAFRLNKASNLAITQVQANEFAEQEAAFHTISIDEHGMSAGMRLNLLPPVHALAAEWRDLWDNFAVAMQPKMADISEVGRLQAYAEAKLKQKDDELEAVERELRQDPKYDQIDDHHSRSKDLFNTFRDKHGNRNAVMFAKNPVYWGLLFLVLLTECFINYHAFNAFWGVPAVAFGTTVILGVLLALAAHGHGEILKQWSFRFGPERDPAMRWTDWRMFGMSTGALIIVLGFTGWARWAAAMDTLGSQGQASALGNIGIVQVDPLRDVMISLIANLGAWMVGVIISYLAHDPDPDYMAATKQFRVARRAWNRARAAHSVRLKHIEAKHAKIIQEKTKTAETRRKAVTGEMDMFEQVTTRREAVQRELEAVTTRNVDVYRDALVKIALSRQGQVQMIRAETNTPFSPFEYKAMQIAPAQIMSQLAA